ncbi:MAG TPA: co-chaperone DjlA [Candidatus Competibacteraceae bacterium]|nr:co-chaperone DjlA [Candidatus Competibacteraceae bacterium]HPF60101.1 co-chaperone DjlA [Candidatus Competibacteraceae bacterium]HRY19519.1 co-chaperone DjlA [Candidatus Competibacteraceae bacterium]
MFGKLFGGAFGFMVGGPLGALLGAAVGHNFDQSQWKTVTSSTHETTGRDHARNVFNATAFQIMGCLAKADGRVSEREIAAARAMMDHLQLNASQRQSAIDGFTAGKQPEFSVETAIEVFQHACCGYPSMLQQLLELLLNIAYADGSLHPQTHARLLSVAERLGIHRVQFETLHTLFRAQRWAHQSGQDGFGDASGAGTGWQRERQHDRRPATAVNSLNHAYSILGLKREAGTEEIKLAYRRLIRQHHPDKLASDVSPVELARATERTREITAAYDRIREARGF